MTDTTIKSVTPVADNASMRVHLNDRNETQFRGTRSYPCKAKGCNTFDQDHELQWGESLMHVAFCGSGLDWDINVTWAPDFEHWGVYGELQNDAGTLDPLDSARFYSTLQQAFRLEQMLNENDLDDDKNPASFGARLGILSILAGLHLSEPTNPSIGELITLSLERGVEPGRLLADAEDPFIFGVRVVELFDLHAYDFNSGATATNSVGAPE